MNKPYGMTANSLSIKVYLSLKTKNMETVMVTLKHAKAKKLLMDLEELDLIQVNDAYPLIRSAEAPHLILKTR